MADQKLTALTALAALSADDLFYVVDDPAGAATSHKLATSVLDTRFASAAQGALAATALQAANNLSDVANAGTARSNLGLGTAATQSAAAFATAAQGLLADSALQLDDIGVIVQGYDADLDTIAGLAKTDGSFIVGDGAAWTVESGATALASIGGAPVGAKYIVQQADGTLTNEQALGALATGLLKNTTTSGVLSIGVAGTDYAGIAFANVFTAAQTIDGSADEPQLIVKAHSTQNEDIFQLVNDAGVKVLGIRESAGYCRFTTDVSNDNYWFTEGFSVSDGANIFNVNSGGSINFLSGGHIGISDSGGGRYVQFRSDKRVGFGDNFTPGATLEVRQASAAGGIPVLWLKQAHTTQEIIRFEATVGAGNPIDTAALGAYYGKVRVYVEGVGAKWLALYD